MRFDDMLATVLAQPTPDARAVGLKWRQLVDLIAQRRSAPSSLTLETAYAALDDLRGKLALGERVAAARAVGGQRIPARLVELFANDNAAVAAPVMRGARLDVAEWLALLPRLGPTARALLRHREDLHDDVRRSLADFGTVDLVIEGEHGLAAPAVEPTGSQIREMVARIEAFRQQRAQGVGLAAAEHEPDGEPEAFRWESGIDGVLAWSEGFAREGLIGHSVAMAARNGDEGVEPAVAAAFAARRAFRDGRLRTPDGGWRISGVPLFDGASGRFLGFRGTGRRPRADERDLEQPAGLMGTALPATALREMVHELRTPLNAIIGFAELIDGQFMGPAGQRQRARAGDIRDQAQRLVRALEDLDLAARLDGQLREGARVELTAGTVDMAALVSRVHTAFEAMASERKIALRVEVTPDLLPASIDPDAAERLVSRLLHAAIGVAGPGETVGVRLQPGAGGAQRLMLSIDRPSTIRGPGAAAMLDPGFAPAIDMSGAPALGLGFALRLVRNLARSAGGDLTIEADAFILSLPTQARDEVGNGQGG